jgi:Na+/alanine symporter
MNTGANLEGRALAQTAVTLQSNNVVPEFPSILILPLFMIPTLLAVIIYKKRSLGYTKRLPRAKLG